MTNNLIQIPWGVEAVWCILTPKNLTNDSKIRKIACCSLYSKPDSRKKSLLLDHISDAFNILSKKYGRGLHFIIAGDTNYLNLQPILNLSPTFCQIVQDFTRMDPPKLWILFWWHFLTTIKFLNVLIHWILIRMGKKIDHKIVVAKPIHCHQ